MGRFPFVWIKESMRPPTMWIATILVIGIMSLISKKSSKRVDGMAARWADAKWLTRPAKCLDLPFEVAATREFSQNQRESALLLRESDSGIAANQTLTSQPRAFQISALQQQANQSLALQPRALQILKLQQQGQSEFGIAAKSVADFGIAAAGQSFGIAAKRNADFGIGAKSQSEFGIAAKSVADFGIAAARPIRVWRCSQERCRFRHCSSQAIQSLGLQPRALQISALQQQGQS